MTLPRGRCFAMSNLPETAVRQAAVDCLNRLKAALAPHGFSCQIIEPRGTAAFARVKNDAAPQLRDDISCSPGSGTDLYFWWSWGDVLAPVTDVADAVVKIRYVLAHSEA